MRPGQAPPARLALALLGWAWSCACVAAALPEVVAKAIMAHPEVRAAQAQLRANDELIEQSRSPFLPELSLSWRDTESRAEQLGTELDRTSRRSEAVLRWNVFRGNADLNQLKLAKKRRGAAAAELEGVRDQIAIEVSTAYIDVLRLRAIQADNAALVTEYRALSARVGERVRAGRISSADRDRILAALIDAQARDATLRAQLHAAEYRFERLTGQAPDSLEIPDFSAREWKADILAEQIKSRNPELQAARRQAEASERQIGVARGDLMPSVDLELRRRLSADIEPAEVTDTVDSSQIAVTFDMPLGGASLNRVDEALARHSAARAEADAVELRIDNQLRALLHELSELRSVAPLLTERVGATTRVIDAYDLQFDAGRRSLGDLATAHADRFGARRALIENGFRSFEVRARLLTLSGEIRTALAESYEPGQQPTVGSTRAALTTPASDPFRPHAQVEAWARDWASGDFARYSSHYHDDFAPAEHATRASWAIERKRRLSRTGITVEFDQLHATGLPDGRFVTRFRQRYDSPTYNDEVTKELTWARAGARWKIVSEVSFGPYR